MSKETNKYKFRDGTRQADRMVQALDPAYAQIDGRTVEDLLRYAQELSKRIKYIDFDNQENGDWRVFLEGDPAEMARYLEDPSAFDHDPEKKAYFSRPHFALFLSFLGLMRKAKGELNHLSQRHLDFYYNDVLRFTKKPAIPDSVHVLFELEESGEQTLLSKGTALLAGEDSKGSPLIYRTDQDMVVNHGLVAQLKSVCRDGENYFAASDTTTIIADTSVQEEFPRWKTFGHTPDLNQLKPARIGFAIASPILLLTEGNRIIIVTLYFPEDHKINLTEEQQLPVKLSSKTGLFNATATLRNETNHLKMEINLSAENKNTVEPFGKETAHTTLPQSEYPFLLVEPTAAQRELFLNMINIQIAVEVKGVSNLKLENESGSLNSKKAFEPFVANSEFNNGKYTGQVISSNNRFYFGSPEICSKRIDSLKWDIEWQGTDPKGNLILGNNQKGVINEKIINELTSYISPPDIDVELNDWERYYYIENSKPIKSSITPKIRSFKLDYTASLVGINDTDKIEVYQVHPFGWTAVINPDAEETMNLIPDYNNLGELYIGIENLQPPCTFSLLFQMAEGSANPDLDPLTVNWSYLGEKDWQTPSPHNPQDVQLLLNDNTNGLLQSGIVQLSIPENASNENSLMPIGLHWVRLFVQPIIKPEETASDLNPLTAICDTIEICSNAVRATFFNNENAPDHLIKPLPANSIEELQKQIPAIAKITQPFTSTGGKPIENNNVLYTRISERLRHKNRAITIWDYERLVLENFPEIYKVKCTRGKKPGSVDVIVIPNIQNILPFDPFEPKVPANTLLAIKQLLLTMTTPLSQQYKDPGLTFVQINVRNPSYHPIQLDFDVKFKPGFDPSFYLNKLHMELLRHLAPWAYDQGADIAIGGNIYRYAMVHFIEQQPYVDFVAKLNLYELDKNGMNIQNLGANDALENDDVAGIWVSARQHYITVLYDEEIKAGIGNMRIEYDFFIENKN